MSPLPYHINKPSNQLPGNNVNAILKYSNALSYHRSLPGYAPTPVWSLNEMAKSYGIGNLYIKDESFRFELNAFKGLGASYAIYQQIQRNPKISVFCTASDGNHGKSVAWSARLAGKEARVFMPKGTVTARIEAIESQGAVVEIVNGNYDMACGYAKEMSQKNGWTLVQDTAWEGYEDIPAQIMAGYLTHFQELEDSLHVLPDPKIDIVFLQSGVGSWAGAAAWYYVNRYGHKRPKLVVVEPVESDGFLESLRQDRRTFPKGSLKTIMAGLNCGIPSLIAWNILKDNVDAAMAIEDKFAKMAMKKLYFPKGNDPKIISGESGAAGLAGFIALMEEERYNGLKKALRMNDRTKVLVFNTEGATDPENFNNIINDTAVKIN